MHIKMTRPIVWTFIIINTLILAFGFYLMFIHRPATSMGLIPLFFSVLTLTKCRSALHDLNDDRARTAARKKHFSRDDDSSVKDTDYYDWHSEGEI